MVVVHSVRADCAQGTRKERKQDKASFWNGTSAGGGGRLGVYENSEVNEPRMDFLGTIFFSLAD